MSMLLLCVVAIPTWAAKKKAVKGNPQDPYATAELATPLAVSAGDLAYRAIFFEDFVIPAEWEAKARKLANETEESATARLTSTKAFSTVGKKPSQMPDEPSLVVKTTLLNYRMVGGKTRFFAGAAAGTSYITYHVQVVDGKSGAPVFERDVSTENNAFAAAWSFNDKKLPTFLGNVLGDYVALRARKDKGVGMLPLDADVASASAKKKKKG